MGVLVVVGFLQLLAEFVRALVFFQGIDPLLGLVVRILGGFAEPKHRVSKIVKCPLLKGERRLGRGEGRVEMAPRFLEILGAIRCGSGVVMKSGVFRVFLQQLLVEAQRPPVLVPIHCPPCVRRCGQHGRGEQQ